MAPVRGHLATAGCGIRGGADRLHQHFDGRDAKRQAKCAIAVIREHPVGAGTKKQPHCGRYGFVAGAGDLEVDLVLPLELDFAVIEAAGKEHRPVKTDERVTVEAVVFANFELGVELGHFDASLHCHWVVCPRLEVGSVSPRKLNYTEIRSDRWHGRQGLVPACGLMLWAKLACSNGQSWAFGKSPANWSAIAAPRVPSYSRVSNCLFVSSNVASFSWTTCGWATLKSSSAGMRSSHCFSVIFSWPEK